MKRIEDLKENECIEIRNKKEAKAVQKLCDVNFVLIDGIKYPFYYFPTNKHGYDIEMVKKTDNCVYYKASEFISKKKSLKKRVKELEKQMKELKGNDFKIVASKSESKYDILTHPDLNNYIDKQKPNPNNDVDWDKRGQLLISNDNVLVINTGVHSDYNFEATVLSSVQGRGSCIRFSKDLFELYGKTHSICLANT